MASLSGEFRWEPEAPPRWVSPAEFAEACGCRLEEWQRRMVEKICEAFVLPREVLEGRGSRKVHVTEETTMALIDATRFGSDVVEYVSDGMSDPNPAEVGALVTFADPSFSLAVAGTHEVLEVRDHGPGSAYRKQVRLSCDPGSWFAAKILRRVGRVDRSVRDGVSRTSFSYEKIPAGWERCDWPAGVGTVGQRVVIDPKITPPHHELFGKVCEVIWAGHLGGDLLVSVDLDPGVKWRVGCFLPVRRARGLDGLVGDEFRALRVSEHSWTQGYGRECGWVNPQTGKPCRVRREDHPRRMVVPEISSHAVYHGGGADPAPQVIGTLPPGRRPPSVGDRIKDIAEEVRWATRGSSTADAQDLRLRELAGAGVITPDEVREVRHHLVPPYRRPITDHEFLPGGPDKAYLDPAGCAHQREGDGPCGAARGRHESLSAGLAARTDLCAPPRPTSRRPRHQTRSWDPHGEPRDDDWRSRR